MKSKKADDKLIWIIVAIAIGLSYLAIYTGVWKNLFGNSVAGINENLASAGDKDNDGVINIEDKCPCVSGTIENNGCPDGYKIAGTNMDKETTDCLSKT